jgi:hypothetical protein
MILALNKEAIPLAFASLPAGFATLFFNETTPPPRDFSNKFI